MSNISEKSKNLHPEMIKFQNTLREKYNEENKAAKKGQIVFVGSSTMEMFPIGKMQESLELDKIIYNRGIRAAITDDVLNHMDTLIFDLKPAKVFINIGSNDIGYHISLERLLKNYDEILSKIKMKLPETIVYLMAYLPVNTVDDFGDEEHHSSFHLRNNENLQKANKEIQKLADKYGYTFIDISNGVADENGNLKKELTFDGMHMFPAGYEIILKNMMSYFKD